MVDEICSSNRNDGDVPGRGSGFSRGDEVNGMVGRDGSVVLDIFIDRKSLKTATAEALAAVEGKRGQIVFACANPHSIVVSRRDRAFQTAMQQADLVVADGVGITLMARIVGVAVGPRISGSDYFLALMKGLEGRGNGRVFFFGSSEKVLGLISERMKEEYPCLAVCGAISPPFRPWHSNENDEMVAKINAARPDILWVGLTAPKQEKWVAENRAMLDVPVIGSIGAVFDFFAGTVPRAPRWMCTMGLEWLFRMIKEPQRMWRRNFVSTPWFIVLMLWHHLLRFDQDRLK